MPVDSGDAAVLENLDSEPSFEEACLSRGGAALDPPGRSGWAEVDGETAVESDSLVPEDEPLTGTSAIYTSYDVNVNTTFWGQVHQQQHRPPLLDSRLLIGPPPSGSVAATAIFGRWRLFAWTGKWAF